MAETTPRLLLIPVAAAADPVAGLAYAQQCRNAGQPVDVCLLHVIEPVKQWQVLRFMTRAEVARFQSQRAADCLERAAAALEAAQITCRTLIRHGRVAETIVQMAEEIGCAEIVMPRPARGLCRWLSRDTATRVVRRQADIAVTLVH